MNIKRIVTGNIGENCYVLNIGKDYLVIDPGDNFEDIKASIKGELLAILITHRHFDHIGALNHMVRFYEAPVYQYISIDEQEYKIGDFVFNVLHTPGHSNDSVTYYFRKDKVMFTGDFLFKGSIGRCDLPTGNMRIMRQTIEKIKKFPEDILVYPGHGEATTLKDEFDNNPYFVENDSNL